jgi:hypothetical protein
LGFKELVEKTHFRGIVVQLAQHQQFAGRRFQAQRFDCSCRRLLYSLYAMRFLPWAGFAAANDDRTISNADGVYTERGRHGWFDGGLTHG